MKTIIKRIEKIETDLWFFISKLPKELMNQLIEIRHDLVQTRIELNEEHQEILKAIKEMIEK